MGLFGTKKTSRSESIVFDREGLEGLKEAYNRLKDNVLYYGVDGVKKVIQIESSIPTEGKTTTLSNLAVSLGKSGKKVCVVDLDFRKARLHRSFELPNDEGLADYMVGKITKKDAIKETRYQNVWLLPRGSEIPNSTVILTSEKMVNLIKELRDEFDFVLLDCPPVLVVSDYIHISRLSDGVLFVAAYGQTKKKQIGEAIQLLKYNKIEILGAVFTFYDPKKSNDSNEYNYGYYNYYGYGDRKHKKK